MHTEVANIRKKMVSEPWPKYLKAVSIRGMRGWTGQEIRFDFPVTAIAGENGCGKSTVLKAVAACYGHPSGARSYYPGVFFPDTAWEETSGVVLSYKVREGDTERDYWVAKRTRRWRPSGNRPKRHVILQDISRTLPLDATAGYALIARRGSTETSAEALSSELTSFYSSILGRKYDSARLAKSSLDKTRKVGVVNIGSLQYSQFHQGAGEDATLDLLALLQNIDKTALILVDEVEASLHPRAQRRLVHFLLWLARTKSIQVIVSTHSPYVLDELPPDARILLERRSDGVQIIYGPTPNYALNRMDSTGHPDLYLFTEDEEASTLVTELLRHGGVEMQSIRCMAVGPGNVVAAMGSAGAKRLLPIKCIGVLDADQPVKDGCVVIPGTAAPERQVFQDVAKLAVSVLAARLGLADAGVSTALANAMVLKDHHEWPDAAAKELAQSPEYLWVTMCQVWARNCAEAQAVGAFVDTVKKALE